MRGFRFSEKIKALMFVFMVSTLVLSACQPAAAPTSVPEVTQAPAVTTEAVEPTAAATEAVTEEVTEAVATPAGTGLTEATINVADNPEYGPILVDGQGMTLYIFTKDEADKSNCDAACLEKWPPLLTQGNPTLGEGVDPALVGSAETTDGRSIVTYNQMPLYYWYKDSQPGDTDGQGVGDVWYVINPAGEIIEAEARAATAETPPAAGTPAAASAGASADAPAGTGLAVVTINVANDPQLGPILVDGQGMTLYMFTKDEADKSNCDAACQEKWPPLLVAADGAAPELGEGVDPALIGTARLANGRTIATYNHMPLYYWYQDAQPGDTDGQGVGEVWYVVAPDGTPVGLQQPPAQPTPAATQKPEKNNDSGGYGGY